MMEKESEQSQLKLSQLQMKNKGLKAELEEIEQQLDDTEVSTICLYFVTYTFQTSTWLL